MSKTIKIQIKPFKSSLAWEKWLLKNHAIQQGVWLKVAKKASGFATVTYDGALDAALCYGWIDGQKRSFDKNYFLQKFTPRRPQSLWSKRNVIKVAQLIKLKKMQPAGLAEVLKAKKDGRFNTAYASQKDMVIPEDFMQAVKRNKKAAAFFATLNKTSLYSIYWRLQTAKTTETRERRFKILLQKLVNSEKI